MGAFPPICAQAPEHADARASGWIGLNRTRVLCELMGCTSVDEAQAVRIQRIDDAVASGSLNRESVWSESIVVGRIGISVRPGTAGRLG